MTLSLSEEIRVLAVSLSIGVEKIEAANDSRALGVTRTGVEALRAWEKAVWELVESLRP